MTEHNETINDRKRQETEQETIVTAAMGNATAIVAMEFEFSDVLSF